VSPEPADATIQVGTSNANSHPETRPRVVVVPFLVDTIVPVLTELRPFFFNDCKEFGNAIHAENQRELNGLIIARLWVLSRTIISERPSGQKP
jgi:hypothetical protein